MSSHSFLMFCAVLFAPLSPASSQGNCAGCVGAGGTASASGGTCGGMVSISVVVEPGQCRWIASDDELLFLCVQTLGCKTSVTRSWSGLPAGTKVDACVVVDGQELCLRPKIPGQSPVGNGESRPGPELKCSDDSNGPTFTVEAASCGLTAEVTPTCTGCHGDI